MNKRELTPAQWHLQRETNTQKLKDLWKELEALQEAYIDCGARDSEVDSVLQRMVHAMSSEVPVAVPTSPDSYRLLGDDNPTKATERAKEFAKILKQMKSLWKTFDGGLLPDELYTMVEEKCWRFCQRP